jgi:hypothetical protein
MSRSVSSRVATSLRIAAACSSGLSNWRALSWILLFYLSIIIVSIKRTYK